jgi:hypothetical protein
MDGKSKHGVLGSTGSSDEKKCSGRDWVSGLGRKDPLIIDLEKDPSDAADWDNFLHRCGQDKILDYETIDLGEGVTHDDILVQGYPTPDRVEDYKDDNWLSVGLDSDMADIGLQWIAPIFCRILLTTDCDEAYDNWSYEGILPFSCGIFHED